MLSKTVESKLFGTEVIPIGEPSLDDDLMPVKAVLSSSVNNIDNGYGCVEKTKNSIILYDHKGFSLFTNLHFFNSFIYKQAKQSKAKQSKAKQS